MGFRKKSNEVKLNCLRLKTVKNFAKKLFKLINSERLTYMKKISKKEVDIVSELILNFLHGNIRSDQKSIDLLRRIKKCLYLLVNRKSGIKIKRIILSSLKGINILNIILPLVLNTLYNPS